MPYEYTKCKVIRVIDGDTVRVDVDLGCDTHVNLTLRLAGIDAPEMGTPAGVAAKAHLEAVLGSPVTVRTIKDRREKYGRYLAYIETITGDDVATVLIESGHAVRWPAK